VIVILVNRVGMIHGVDMTIDQTRSGLHIGQAEMLSSIPSATIMPCIF